MKLSNFFIMLMCVSFVSCKAQQPDFVGVGRLSNTGDITPEEYVNWYNKLVDKPKFDTVSAFVMPSFSDMRYVIIRTLNSGDVARVEKKNGQFLYFLHEHNQLVSVVNWNGKGEIVSGLDEIMVSGCPLVIQYENCPTCKFNPNYLGKL